MEPPVIIFKLVIPKLRVSKISLSYDQLVNERLIFWLNFEIDKYLDITIKGS